MVAKLGPFCKRDNCSLVRGVLESDNSLLHVICTCMPGAGEWEPGCWVGVCCAAGRCGAMGVAGTLEEVEVVVEVVEKLDGTLQSPLPHTPPQHHYRTSHGPQPVQHIPQGS